MLIGNIKDKRYNINVFIITQGFNAVTLLLSHSFYLLLITLVSHINFNLVTLGSRLTATQIDMSVEGVRYTAPGEQRDKMFCENGFPSGQADAIAKSDLSMCT